MKKLSNTSRALNFMDLSKQAHALDKKLTVLNTTRGDLYLSPFKTWGTQANAGYCLSGILNNPDIIFTTSRSLMTSVPLRWLKIFRSSSSTISGTGMCWSQETLAKQAPRIFKHFKETGLLVKARGGYKLNPILKKYHELKEDKHG